MRTSQLKVARLALALVLSATLLFSLPPQARAAAPLESGLVCSTSASPNPTFNLTATSGYISMPDGNSIFTWSFAPGGGAFQFPGPYMCVNSGDTVTIVVNNTLPEPVSLIFPGIDNVLANGSPSQPVFSGTTLTSLAPAAPANGGSVTYSFLAARPGTFLYQAGSDTAKQMQMGLFGALIIKPAGHPTWAYTDATGTAAFGAFDPNSENVMLLSEIDPALHQAIEFGQAYDDAQLHPRYWLINGRAFPDTIAPNNAPWLPAQPYGALVHTHAQDATTNPGQLPALVRYLDSGSRAHPFHPHGENGTVIARDGTPLYTAGNADLSFEKFSITIGPAQSYDVTYLYQNQEQFNPDSNPVPVTIPQLQNLTFKNDATYYSGSPYLGYQGELPQGTTSFNLCGEFYQVMHSHALYEVANFDAAFGGMLTLERIDPPTPNSCP